MADETKTASRKPRRALRWVGITLGTLVLLLVIVWFVGTSEWALKSIILPRVSESMNAKVTVEEADLAPFSAVELRGLKVETTGPEPLLTAGRVRARYSLLDIVGGNINVSEVLVDAPVVNLITFPDGTSNLDPLTKGDEQKDTKEKKEEKEPGEPPQLRLAKFALNNATVRKIDLRKDGSREVIELSGVNITAEDIGNAQTGQLALAANVRMDQGLTASNGVLAATVGGRFNLGLDAALKPEVVKGQTQVQVTEARGAFQDVAGLGAVLNADLTPTQLKDVSLRFSQNGKNLGALAVSGPFNPDTTEGKLAVVVSDIDQQVLNLAGAAMGVDFNQTMINSTNTVELAQRGRVINVNGALLVANFSATQGGQTTPVLDLRSEYALTYDQTNQTALVQQFALRGTQNNAEFLRGTLAQPMLLDLGKGSNAVNDSAFAFVLTNFNLPDWRAFFPTNMSVASGRLHTTLNLVSQRAGNQLALDLATQLRNLTATVDSNRVENADLTFTTRGTVTDFTAVNLEQFRAELARAGQQALVASGALQYNTASQTADVRANFEAALPQVTALVSVPGLTASAGTVKFDGRVQQASVGSTNDPVLNRTVTGQLNLADLTGAFGSNRFDRFGATTELDVAMRGPQVNIQKFTGSLRQAGQPGGSFNVSGNYHLTNSAGQIAAKVTDLNQNVLRSFLAGALGEKQLESVTINATTMAKLDGAAGMAVKADLQVTNLVVNDPSGQVPKTPLAVAAVADVTRARDVIDLKDVRLALTKTELAPNTLSVAGRIDTSKTNAWTGNLKVTSEGLDVTPYYEIFAGDKTKAPETRPVSREPAGVPPTAPGGEELEPMNLPVSQFNADVNIAKFFLREIAISNLVTKAAVENGRIRVSPLSLTLNGAPAQLDALMNVGVPGWNYDVKANLGGLPVEPIANTFMPEQRGLYKGALLANVDVKGTGITGRNLQQHLGGTLSLTLTNAEIRYMDARFDNRFLQWLVKWVPVAATYLRLPELAESPISLVDSATVITNGTVNLQRTVLESSAFKAGINGTITIRPVLTNSALNDLPLQLSLRRSIAEKARIVAAGSGQTPYVDLPAFLSIDGTVGKPDYDVNAVAVAQIVAGTAGGFIGGDAGNILRGIGALGKGGTTTTNRTGTPTNAPATNTIGNILQALPGLLQKPGETNSAKTNAPAEKRNRGFNLNELLK